MRFIRFFSKNEKIVNLCEKILLVLASFDEQCSKTIIHYIQTMYLSTNSELSLLNQPESSYIFILNFSQLLIKKNTKNEIMVGVDLGKKNLFLS